MSRDFQENRRAFLRGGGLALPLPWLPSLFSRAFAAESTTAPPLRSAFLHFPNGAWMPDWTPADGTSLGLSPSLRPLQPFAENITVVSGLDRTVARWMGMLTRRPIS